MSVRYNVFIQQIFIKYLLCAMHCSVSIKKIKNLELLLPWRKIPSIHFVSTQVAFPVIGYIVLYGWGSCTLATFWHSGKPLGKVAQILDKRQLEYV